MAIEMIRTPEFGAATIYLAREIWRYDLNPQAMETVCGAARRHLLTALQAFEASGLMLVQDGGES